MNHLKNALRTTLEIPSIISPGFAPEGIPVHNKNHTFAFNANYISPRITSAGSD